MNYLAALSASMLLIACGDPMATIPRLADTDIPDDTTTLSVISDAATEKDEEGGFFARLFSRSGNDATGESGARAISDGNDEALPPETYGVTSELPETPQVRENSSKPSKVPGGRIKLLPYGKIARVCDLPKREMGKKVAQHPEKRRRYVLHDTEPGNTAPHTFYLTGFDDGCARQFTASMAIFGSVEMHEQLRYGLPAEAQPYSDTDKAYEKIKSRVCGVRRKKPCGSKLSRLENDTVFLSIYENFGGNQRWSNLLLHSGRVLAQDIKG